LQNSAISQVSDDLARELYQEARAAREERDAKHADLVTAMQALQETDQALRKVCHERQSMHGEINLLRKKVADLEASTEESQRRLAEAEEQRRDWEQRCEASEQRHLAAATRCEQLEARLNEVEALRAEADRRSELVERSAAESVQRALEVERQCQLRAEQQVHEAKHVFDEVGAQRQKEINAALAELQSLSTGQQTLRTELRRAMRPPPVVAYVPPPMPEMPAVDPGASARMAWDEALERTRARVSVARGVQPDSIMQALHFGGSGGGSTGCGAGSLLSGRVKAQAELILSQAGRIQGRQGGG